MACRLSFLLLILALCGLVSVQAQALRGLQDIDITVNDVADPSDDDLSGLAVEGGNDDGDFSITADFDVQAFQDELLAAVNSERAKAGLQPLCHNDKLQAAAQKHSEDMAKNNFMSHTGSNGSTMTSRIVAEGFKYSNLGENVAAGQKDVAAVMKAWMNSSGHRANILGNFKFFGGGMAQNAGSKYKIYWTQDFGSGSSESCACLV